MNPTPGSGPDTSGALRRFLQQEELNFLLTSRVPRIALTRFMGWFSQIRSPLPARLPIAVWRQFTDLDLDVARPQTHHSLHQCFIRESKPGARQVDADPQVLASPCDAIVGACGAVLGTRLFEAKDFPQLMHHLFGPARTPSRSTTGCTSRGG